MSKTILIIPTFREIYKNQIELCIDSRLVNFFSKINKNYKVQIAYTKKISDFDILVLSGGNDIVSHSNKQKDLERSKYDNHYYKIALKNKKIIIGICHGALFLANKFKSSIIKTNHHVGSHYIFNKKKKIKVNSYHNYKIIKVTKYLRACHFADDNSIESFEARNMKVFGIMWHPERYKKFKKFDIKYCREKICI